MNRALPGLLREQRQRAAESRRKLTPADVRDLTLLDTGNAELAERIETELLLQEVANLGAKE